MKYLLRIFINVLAMPVFSRIWGRLARVRRPAFFVKRAIAFYRWLYGIDMDEYIEPKGGFSSLGDFFIRPLNPERRNLVPDESLILSPADGLFIDTELVREDKAQQIKGKNYSLTGLLQQNLDLSKGWFVTTIYLAPTNYHRFHYPVSAQIKAYAHLKGKLFPVNSLGLGLIDNLFIQNERVVSLMDFKGEPFFLVAVGATFVGSIKIQFIKKIRRDNHWKELGIPIQQLDEMGYFAMGSTIVLVFPERLASPIKRERESKIRVGDPLFNLRS
jgi:phosphatidylserine decarboxylase